MDGTALEAALAEARRALQGGALEQADRQYSEILAAHPASVEARLARGRLRARRHDVLAARRDLEMAASLSPQSPEILASLAALYERMALPRLAHAAAWKLLDLRPGAVAPIRLLARIAAPGEAQDALAATAEAALARPDLADGDRAGLNFALGRIRHLAGRHDEAFEHFVAANQARAARDDLSGRETLARSIMTAFARLRWPTHRTSARLILIDGLPKSGAAFLAEALASHDAVAMADNPAILADAAANLKTYSGTATPFPDCVPHFANETWEAAAATMFARLHEDFGPASAYVMAPPSGFLQTGVAAALSPDAVVVELARAPMALGLANFMWGPDQGADYSFSVEGIGRLFRLFSQTMAFWRLTLPTPPIIIDGDALASAPLAAVERILAAANLPPDDGPAAHIAAVPPMDRFDDDLGPGGERAYRAHLGPLRQALWPLPG